MRTTDRAAFAMQSARPTRVRQTRVDVIAACIALLLLLGSAMVLAQDTPKDEASKKDYALIYGTVWGADHRPLAGVLVRIQKQGDKKAKWERVSDRRGEFAVRVPTGEADYVLFAEVKTPAGKKRMESKTHVYTNERVDVSLKLD